MAGNRVAGFLGRVLDEAGDPIGTCFQVDPAGVVVTAWHVLDDLGAGDVDAQVRVDPLRSTDPASASSVARVAAVDPLHDLAVLTLTTPLPATAAGVVATDDMVLTAPVSVTGVPTVEDRHTYRHLDAPGVWAGGATRDDQVPLGRLTASAVLPGMSGAPVVNAAGLVVGVVSARYNSADGWLRDTVWVARTEDLAPLLAGLTTVAVAGRGWAGVTDLTLTVDATQVRLSGAGRDITAPHRGVSAALLDALRGLRNGRAGLTARRDHPTADLAGTADGGVGHPGRGGPAAGRRVSARPGRRRAHPGDHGRAGHAHPGPARDHRRGPAAGPAVGGIGRAR